MQLHEIIGLAASLLLIAFGFYAIAKSPRRLFNWALAAFSLGQAGFNISLLILPRVPNFFFSILPIGFSLALMVPGLLLFVELFPPAVKLTKRFFFIFIPDLFFLLLLPFGLLFRTAVISAEGNPVRTPGPLLPFALTYAVITLGYALSHMFLRWHRARGLQRLRMTHIFFWMGTFLFTMIFIGIILPTFGFYQLNVFTPLLSSLILIGILWSGIRSRLVDVRTIAGRAIESVVIFILLGAVVTTPIAFMRFAMLGSWPDFPFLLAATILATIVFLMLRPFERFVFRGVQKRLFPQLLGAETAMETFHESGTSARTYEELGNVLLKTIPGVVPINEVAILYRTPRGAWDTIAARGFDPTRLSAFLAVLRENPLWTETLIADEEKAPVLGAALKGLEAGAYIPVIKQEQLLGALVLGPQPALDAYSKEEIELLELLTDDIATVLVNVRLWEEQGHLLSDIQHASKSQNEFISVVSHQFRTPLLTIRWNAELLAESLNQIAASPEQETRGDYLFSINASSRFLSSVLEDLFDLMAIEKGNFVLQKHPESFAEVIAEVVRDYRQFATLKNCVLNIRQIGEEPPMFVLDKQRIQRAAGAIIRNAIEYSPKGGTVTIVLKPEGRDGKEGMIMTVKDEGVGIEQKEQARVFEKFFRGDSAKNISPNGTGLALYIAKHILETHGGAVGFMSEAGRGTTFYLFMPAA